MSRIHVLHENPLWLPPLAAAFDQRGLAWTEWFMHGGIFDLSVPPPEGIFYNRMSASSHTRDHRYSAELTAGVLAWLAAHGRRVVNGSARWTWKSARHGNMRRWRRRVWRRRVPSWSRGGRKCWTRRGFIFPTVR